MPPRLRSALFLFTAAAALGQSPAAGPDKFSQPEVPLPPARLADYIGVYQINAQVLLTIIKDPAGRLESRLTGQRFLPISYAGGDEFLIPAVKADVLFGRSRSGHVNTVMIFQHGAQVQGELTDRDVPPVLFLPAAQLAQYEGRYLFPDGNTCTVMVVNGWLYAQVTDQRAYPLFADEKDHFRLDVGEGGIIFDRNRAGEVTDMAIEQNRGLVHLPKAPPDAPKPAAP